MIEKIIEKLEELPVVKEILTSEKHPFIASEIEMISKKAVIGIVQEVAKDGGWISVEVGVPNEGEKVFTTDQENNYHLFTFVENVFVDECGRRIGENHPRYYPPVAWQRIAPYQKGEKKQYCYTCRHYESNGCTNGYSQYWRFARNFDDTCEHWEQRGE